MHIPFCTDERHLIYEKKNVQHCTDMLFLTLPDIWCCCHIIEQIMTFEYV